MSEYIVKSKNKRGYVQESEIFNNYSKAFTLAMECKDSEQYSVIIILKKCDYPNNGEYFLHRIIK